MLYHNNSYYYYFNKKILFLQSSVSSCNVADTDSDGNCLILCRQSITRTKKSRNEFQLRNDNIALPSEFVCAFNIGLPLDDDDEDEDDDAAVTFDCCEEIDNIST